MERAGVWWMERWERAGKSCKGVNLGQWGGRRERSSRTGWIHRQARSRPCVRSLAGAACRALQAMVASNGHARPDCGVGSIRHSLHVRPEGA